MQRAFQVIIDENGRGSFFKEDLISDGAAATIAAAGIGLIAIIANPIAAERLFNWALHVGAAFLWKAGIFFVDVSGVGLMVYCGYRLGSEYFGKTRAKRAD